MLGEMDVSRRLLDEATKYAIGDRELLGAQVGRYWKGFVGDEQRALQICQVVDNYRRNVERSSIITAGLAETLWQVTADVHKVRGLLDEATELARRSQGLSAYEAVSYIARIEGCVFGDVDRAKSLLEKEYQEARTDPTFFYSADFCARALWFLGSSLAYDCMCVAREQISKERYSRHVFYSQWLHTAHLLGLTESQTQFARRDQLRSISDRDSRLR
jgi:hypothetical protein